MIKNRLQELDSLRGLAALFVFLSHFMGMKAFSYLPKWAIYSPLHFFWDGHASVILFFLLSGYVLSLPYLQSNKYIELISFYSKRFFRLYPALIVAICFALTVKKFLFFHENIQNFSTWFQQFWNWQNISISKVLETMILIGPQVDTNLIINVLWSLKVEIILSFIFPFLLIVIKKIEFRVCLILIFSIYLIIGHPWLESGMLPFFSGIILAKYQSSLKTIVESLSVSKSTLLLLFSLIFYTSTFTFQLIWFEQKFLIGFIITLLITMGGMGLILMVLFNKSVNRFFKNNFFIFLGDISYSFYLFHFPILLVVASSISNKFGVYSYWYILIISLCVSLVVSYINYKLIEIQFQRIGKNIIDNIVLKNNFKIDV